jgi:hypothetical protein
LAYHGQQCWAIYHHQPSNPNQLYILNYFSLFYYYKKKGGHSFVSVDELVNRIRSSRDTLNLKNELENNQKKRGTRQSPRRMMESNQKPVPCPTRTIKAGNTNEKKVSFYFIFW